MLGDSNTSLCNTLAGNVLTGYPVKYISVPLCLDNHRNVSERGVPQKPHTHNKESPRMTYGT